LRFIVNSKIKEHEKNFTFTLLLTFAVGSMAQLSKNQSKYVQKIPRFTIDNPVMNPLQPHNNTVSSKSTLEDQLGTTRYDMQTNEAPQNRFYVYPDGNYGRYLDYGMLETSYPDRVQGTTILMVLAGVLLQQHVLRA